MYHYKTNSRIIRFGLVVDYQPDTRIIRSTTSLIIGLVVPK